MKKKTVYICFSIIVAIIVIFTAVMVLNNEEQTYINYKEFNEELENENISSVVIEDNKVVFNKKEDESVYYTDNPNYDGFKEKILLSGVTVKEESTQNSISFVFDIIFYLFFFGVIVFAVTKLYSTSSKTFKLVRNTKTKFSDIAGMDTVKKEMMQIVEILKNSSEYSKKGIRPVKGVIFEGKPGN